MIETLNYSLLLHWAISGHGTIVVIDATVATGRGHIEHAEALLLRRAGNWGGCGHITTLLEVMHNTLQDKLKELILADFPVQKCNVLAITKLGKILFIVWPDAELKVAGNIWRIVDAFNATFVALLVGKMKVILEITQCQQFGLIEDQESLNNEHIDHLIAQLGSNWNIPSHVEISMLLLLLLLLHYRAYTMLSMLLQCQLMQLMMRMLVKMRMRGTLLLLMPLLLPLIRIPSAGHVFSIAMHLIIV